MEDLKMAPLTFKKDKKDGSRPCFTTRFNPHGDLAACFSAFAHGLMVAVEPYTHEGILVAKSKEHGHVLGVQKEVGSTRGLSVLNPFHSKFAAAIYAGIRKTWIKPGARVLYLGAGSGKRITVCHVSDIVGPAGVVYAVEISETSYRGLVRKARKHTNIVPIFEDARHPEKYRNSVGMVDVILCDVAQPDQASILGLNASYCLKVDCHFVISIKASCIDSTVSATSVFVDEVVKLCSDGFLDLELATLEPFRPDHACVVGAFMLGDDFEIGKEEAVDIEGMEVSKQKLTRRINHFKIKLQNPCRKGKKLLVLDIDYTLFDHRSIAENHLQLMRPYLHEFLTSVYLEYDIMIWSATSMELIKVKMGQLGVLDNPNYKITALLDDLAMYTVQSISRGVFTCKPLGLIWAQFPEFYNASNTIMFDDLQRNFMMNPQNGLTIKPFRNAHVNRDSDQELVKLTQYLLAIAELDDLSKLDHNNWELFTEDNAKCTEESGNQDAAS